MDRTKSEELDDTKLSNMEQTVLQAAQLAEGLVWRSELKHYHELVFHLFNFVMYYPTDPSAGRAGRAGRSGRGWARLVGGGAPRAVARAATRDSARGPRATRQCIRITASQAPSPELYLKEGLFPQIVHTHYGISSSISRALPKEGPFPQIVHTHYGISRTISRALPQRRAFSTNSAYALRHLKLASPELYHKEEPFPQIVHTHYGISSSISRALPQRRAFSTNSA
ncbi:hypothetical protein ACJJTC_017809 [Scirpophaga incertulas]